MQEQGPQDPAQGSTSSCAPLVPSQQQNLDFYHEYCRLYLANSILQSQMADLNQERNYQIQKLGHIEVPLLPHVLETDLELLEDGDAARREEETATTSSRRHRAQLQVSAEQLLEVLRERRQSEPAPEAEAPAVLPADLQQPFGRAFFQEFGEGQAQRGVLRT